MSRHQGPIYRKQDFAGFVRRTMALLVDLLILKALTVGLYLAVWSFARTQAQWVSWQLPLASAAVTAWAAYMLGFRFLPNGTPGYRLLRIRYAYVLEGKPPTATILLRSLMAVVLLLFFMLDHVWILFDERKQAWHDKLTGFYVVKRRAAPLGTQPVVQRYINFAGLSLLVWEPRAADGG